MRCYDMCAGCEYCEYTLYHTAGSFTFVCICNVCYDASVSVLYGMVFVREVTIKILLILLSSPLPTSMRRQAIHSSRSLVVTSSTLMALLRLHRSVGNRAIRQATRYVRTGHGRVRLRTRF